MDVLDAAPSTSAPSRARHRSRTRASGTRRWARARALLAAGVVVGVGGAATLASWTDTEWVWAGDGSGRDPGLSAGLFELQQNVWDGPAGAADFVDRESAPGGRLDFTLSASRLTPGDTVYAPMQLRTVADSDAADLTLDGATLAAGTAPFFDALRYGVRTGVPRESCTAAGYASTGTQLVAGGTRLGTGSGTGTVTVAAGGPGTPGPAVDLCFAVTLPAGSPSTLQGQGASPQWAFQGLSR